MAVNSLKRSKLEETKKKKAKQPAQLSVKPYTMTNVTVHNAPKKAIIFLCPI